MPNLLNIPTIGDVVFIYQDMIQQTKPIGEAKILSEPKYIGELLGRIIYHCKLKLNNGKIIEGGFTIEKGDIK